MPREVVVPWASKEHQKLIREADERFRFSEDAKRPYEDLARKAYKAARGYLNEATYPMPTKISVPQFHADTMTQVAREMQAIMAAPPLLRYTPRGKTPYARAQQMENAMGYFLEQMPLYSEMVDILLQRRWFGNVVVHPHWRTETRWVGAWQMVEDRQTVPMLDPLTGEPMLDPLTGEPVAMPVIAPRWEYFEGERETYDGPWFSSLHFTEWFPDHAEKYLQDGEFFIVRKMRDKRWLKKQAARGIYNKQMVNRLLADNAGSPWPWDGKFTGDRLESTQKWQEEVGLHNQVGWQKVTDRQWFEVLEYWRHDGWVTTIVNGSYVVRHRRNPYAHGQYPFIHLRNYYQPGSFYADSDYVFTEKLYMAYTDLVNAGATQAFLGVFPPLKADKTLDHRQFRQRGVRDLWRVDGPDQVLEFVAVPPQALNFAQAAMADVRAITDQILGVSEAYKGGTPEASSTPASTVTAMLQAAGVRLAWHVDGIGEQFLRPLGDQCQHLVRQLCSRDLVTRVLGDPQADPITIPIDELRDGDFVCTPLYPTAQAWLLEQKRMSDFYELIVRTQEPNANRRGAYIALVEAQAPRQKERLVRSEEEIQAEQMAMMQQQQQAEMANMDKMRQAQEYAAEMGRQADQTEAVIRGAQAQGRAITETRPARVPSTDQGMEELSSELGDIIESYT